MKKEKTQKYRIKISKLRIFFKEIKTDKPLPRLKKKKEREKTQVSKIKNQRKEIIMDGSEIKRIIRD